MRHTFFHHFWGEFCFHSHHSRDFLENLEGDYSTDVALSQNYILTMPTCQVKEGEGHTMP